MILDRLAERRWSLRNPPESILDLLTGGKTAAGVRVSPSSAMGLSVWYAAIRAISEDIGKLPLPVYRRKSRGKDRVRRHAVDLLFNTRSNPFVSAMAFRETIVSHALGWGDGYAKITLGPGGTPLELWNLPPDGVEPFIEGNVLMYRVQEEPQGPQEIFPPEEIFHLHGLGFDGFRGYSVATIARESIASGIAGRRAGAALWGNNSRPGGILEVPHRLRDGGKKLRDSWQETFGGPGNVNKTAVLEQGASFKPISMPNRDAQWIESQQFSVEEVARWFRMPPHKLQQLIYGTYSNVDHLAIEYVVDTLTSWMTRFEQEANAKLFRESERGTLFVEHLADGLLRGDMKARYEAYAVGRQWGWFSVNDIREKENMNPIPDDAGDMYLVPTNMADAEDFGNEPPPEVPVPPQDEEEDDVARAALKMIVSQMTRGQSAAGDVDVTDLVCSLRPMMESAFSSVVRVECDKASRAAKRGTVQEWCGKFYTEHHIYVRGALIPVVDAIASAVWVIAGGTPAKAEEELAKYAEDAAKRHVDESRAAFKGGVDLDALLKDWSGDRAKRSAVRECDILAECLEGLLAEKG